MTASPSQKSCNGSNSAGLSKIKGTTSCPFAFIYPHFPFLTAATNPSLKEATVSYWQGITLLPSLSTKPHFQAVLTAANPSEKSLALL